MSILSRQFPRPLCAAISVANLITFLPATASALENKSDYAVEEVVVTAQKREQSAQDVGIAVSTVTGDQMQSMNITNSQDIIMAVPGLSASGVATGGTLRTYSIRGVNQSDVNDNQEPAVAVYVDEAYVSLMAAQSFSMFDLERVQVLKGPQGTLFGRNATGGLAQFITKKPTREFEAQGNVRIGEHSLFGVEAVVSGPLSDKVSTRLSVFHEENGNYIDNLDYRDIGDKDTDAFRLQFMFEPTDDLELLVKFERADHKQTQAYKSLPTLILSDGNVISNPDPLSTDAAGYRDASDDPFKTNQDLIGFLDVETWNLYATANYNFNDNTTLTLVTDYREYKKDYLEDVDAGVGDFATLFGGLPQPYGVPTISFFQKIPDHSQFSQEVRLTQETDDLIWVVGAYYLDIDGTYQQGLLELDVNTRARQKTHSLSAFAQIEYALSHQFSLTSGVRVINEKKSFFLEDIPGGLSIADDLDDMLWSGKIALDWHVNDDFLAYASVNRGVKAGGFNQIISPTVKPEDIPFKEEVLLAYEVGFKSTLWDSRLQVNGAAFYYDYQDYQAFSLVVEGSAITTKNFNANSTIKGVELEISAAPAPGLDLQFGVSYIDTNVKGIWTYRGIEDVDATFAPDLNVTGLARYEWPAFGGRMAVQGNFAYVDKYSASYIGTSIYDVGNYTVGNASLIYTSEDDRWTASLWVKNITDEKQLLSTFDLSDFTGGRQDMYGQPRWFGVSFGYKWN